MRSVRTRGSFSIPCSGCNVVVTDGPCYFKGEDLETWRRFHTWVRTTLKDMYPDDPDFDEDWVEGFEVHVEGCQ